MPAKTQPTIAPIEYCGVSSEYPIYVHIFRKKEITQEEVIARHWHTNIEMTYRIKYSGEIILNGNKYPLNDDSLFIINSRDIHEIHTFPQSDMYAILVSIPYEFIKSLVPDVESYRFAVGSNLEQMKKIILEMGKIETDKNPHSHIRMYSLALELIYFMMEDSIPKRYFGKNESNIGIGVRKSEIITYLNEHIHEIRSVEDLSSAFGYSREYFSRFVSKYFGITCKVLIDQIRLDYAIHHIKNSSRSLTEIASLAGFSSYRNFRILFKKYYGMYPELFASF